jgi:hypothetical protein
MLHRLWAASLMVRNPVNPCHICYVTKKSPYPYYLQIRPCSENVGRHRWEILDSDGLLETSRLSFATEHEAHAQGRREMQGLVKMWNKK